jgi:site-specific recombinase XerD
VDGAGFGRSSVEPVERYLAFLTDVDRSPNTIKAYAHDLKDWFVFLDGWGLDWREVRLEDVGEFVAWLRLPRRRETAGSRCCRRWRLTAARRR